MCPTTITRYLQQTERHILNSSFVYWGSRKEGWLKVAVSLRVDGWHKSLAASFPPIYANCQVVKGGRSVVHWLMPRRRWLCWVCLPTIYTAQRVTPIQMSMAARSFVEYKIRFQRLWPCTVAGTRSRSHLIWSRESRRAAVWKILFRFFFFFRG